MIPEIKIIKSTKDMNHLDIKAINHIRNDLKVMTLLNVEQVRNESIKSSKSWLSYKIDKALYFFGVYLNDELIGFFNIDNQKFGDGIIPGVEVGFALNSNYWGKGFGKETFKKVIIFLKKTDCKFIVARVLSSNKSSLKLFETLDFIEAGRFSKIDLRKGDDLIFFIRYL
tara:strand:+ start:595 stop:1104 length:510 start_codon:yes stop_codon:yes gene_type:complete